ncbi:helix-turn-helix transcriptional regulator, partial [Peribacillus frigoritolerans]
MLENRVRELRARFRWTQDDLAKKIEVTRQTGSTREHVSLSSPKK